MEQININIRSLIESINIDANGNIKEDLKKGFVPLELNIFIDYKSLLKKYIKHVDNCEGTDFVDCVSVPFFTDDEILELKKLSNNE
jgi:hypothetical protein